MRIIFRINIITGFSFLIILNCLGQSKNYFEGTIAYRHDLKTNGANVNVKLLESLMGNGSLLSFKEGNYRHDYDGGIFEYDIYDKVDNKVYSKKRSNDTIYWTDCSLPGKEIKSFDFSATQETILGMKCDRLIVQYDKMKQVQYYNSDSIAINPDWFKNYTLNGQNIIDEKEKSIFLKSETDFGKFNIITTAFKISHLKIDESVFKIPAKALLVQQK